MSDKLSLSFPRGRATGALVLVLASLVGLACSADGARSDSHASPAAAGLTGKTPGGGTYRFSVRSTKARRLCELLAVRYPNADASVSDCQPARGSGAHGMWALDCRTRDFNVVGAAYAGIRSVVLVPAGGAPHRARLVPRGGRRAFVLVADGDLLPAQVRALDRRGRVVSHEDFDAADALCAPESGVQPLSVSYPF